MGGCGATLIGPDVVLGAAHCGGALGRYVTIGSVQVDVIDERIHPSYSSSSNVLDFYLYRLRSPVTTTGTQVVVNTDAASPYDGQPLTVMGYGTTSEGGFASAELRDVVVPKVSDAACQSAYGTTFNPDVMLCAGEAGKDSCQGDSGGPIVIRNGNIDTLVGVVSFGAGCARPETPGVYAEVSSGISWISTVACSEWGSSVNGLCGPTVPIVTTASPTPVPIMMTASPTAVPVFLPVFVPAPAPIETPVLPPVVETTTCTTLSVDFISDGWPIENYIVLTDGIETFWDLRNFEPNMGYSWSRCVTNDACTLLDVTDAYGDGLDGNAGGYIKVTFGSRIMYEGSNIGYGFLVYLGNRC